MGKLVGTKQMVYGSLAFGGLAVLVIAQTALATPIIRVETTSLAIGTFRRRSRGQVEDRRP